MIERAEGTQADRFDTAELVPCPNSYHVVTLDFDAALVQERVLAFARELDGAKAG